MKKILFILLFLPLLAPAQISQQPFHGLTPFMVTEVHDGDGMKGHFLTGEKDAVRIRRIDAPEIIGYVVKSQPYGRVAGDSLRNLIKGHVVLLDTMPGKGGSSRDPFGRLLADVYMEDSTNVQFWLVEHGLAWYFKDNTAAYPKMNTALFYAEKTARADGVGLWASYPTRTGRKARIYTPGWWKKHYSVWSKTKRSFFARIF